MITFFFFRFCFDFVAYFIFLLPQNKIAKDADSLKFEEEDLILKVGDYMEARSLSSLYLSLSLH